jgi:hypothetical protein
MHQCRVACALSTTLALALGFCVPLALSGCGGSSENQEVKVEKPPAQAGKDSIDYFLKTKGQPKGQQKAKH